MSKYFLILFFISLELFGMKIKAVQQNDIVKVKILIKNDMRGKEEAKKKNLEEDYIKHIVARVKNQTVYDIIMSDYVSKDPLVKFQYTYLNRSNEIEIIAIDNKNNIFQRVQKLNDKVNFIMPTKNIASIKIEDIENNIRQATTIQEVIFNVYGEIETIKGDMELNIIGDVDARARVKITSTLDLESIIVLTDANPRPFVAMFKIPDKSLIAYDLLFAAKPIGKIQIVIIGKGRDGKFYEVSKETISANFCET